MPEDRSHDILARLLARRYRADYNQSSGADVQTSRMAIEVETESSIDEAGRQLQGFKKPVYVAVTTQGGVKKALERYEGTTIGIMDNKGNIVKRSKRG